MSSMPATYSPLSSLSEQPGLGAAMLEAVREQGDVLYLSFSPSPSLPPPHFLFSSLPYLFKKYIRPFTITWHCTRTEEATGGMDFDILKP